MDDFISTTFFVLLIVCAVFGVRSCFQSLDHIPEKAYCENTCGNKRSRASEEFCFCMDDSGEYKYHSKYEEKK